LNCVAYPNARQCWVAGGLNLTYIGLANKNKHIKFRIQQTVNFSSVTRGLSQEGGELGWGAH